MVVVEINDRQVTLEVASASTSPQEVPEMPDPPEKTVPEVEVDYPLRRPQRAAKAK